MKQDIDSLGFVISREWPISLPIITKVSMFPEVIRNYKIANVPESEDDLIKVVTLLFLRNIGNVYIVNVNCSVGFVFVVVMTCVLYLYFFFICGNYLPQKMFEQRLEIYQDIA